VHRKFSKSIWTYIKSIYNGMNASNKYHPWLVYFSLAK
jgi:hypothetical protein